MGFFAVAASAQSTLDSVVVGKWETVNVQVLEDSITDEQKQVYLQMNEALLRSSFEFLADRNFNFYCPIREIQIQNGHWKTTPGTGEVLIQEWHDKDTERSVLMGIDVTTRNGKTFFFLQETPFLLQVERTK